MWVRPGGGKNSEDIHVSAHVDDCLLSRKSLTVMAKPAVGAHAFAHAVGREHAVGRLFLAAA
jgi:hypothetical protein